MEDLPLDDWVLQECIQDSINLFAESSNGTNPDHQMIFPKKGNNETYKVKIKGRTKNKHKQI